MTDDAENFRIVDEVPSDVGGEPAVGLIIAEVHVHAPAVDATVPIQLFNGQLDAMMRHLTVARFPCAGRAQLQFTGGERRRPFAGNEREAGEQSSRASERDSDHSEDRARWAEVGGGGHRNDEPDHDNVTVELVRMHVCDHPEHGNSSLLQPDVMDALSFHLMVNHVPILFGIVGTLFVLLATVIQRRVFWRIGTAALCVAALSFYPVQWTGDNAEHEDMKRWYIQRDAIHEHEEAADKALFVVLLAGAVAGYAFWRARGPQTDAPVVPAWLRGAVVVTALASTAATVRTAYIAGFIAHKNPLLMRATVPPADSIPVKKPFGPRPPE